MDAFYTIYRQLLRYINNFGPNAWAVIAILVLAIGVYCMKGYGSRDTY